MIFFYNSWKFPESVKLMAGFHWKCSNKCENFFFERMMKLFWTLQLCWMMNWWWIDSLFWIDIEIIIEVLARDYTKHRKSVIHLIIGFFPETESKMIFLSSLNCISDCPLTEQSSNTFSACWSETFWLLISITFYGLLFYSNVITHNFSVLWSHEIGKKAAHTILVKLTLLEAAYTGHS